MPLKYINWASYFVVYLVLSLYSLSYLAGPLRHKGCDNRDPYICLDPYHCCLHNRKVSCNYHPNGILHFMNALGRYGQLTFQSLNWIIKLPKYLEPVLCQYLQKRCTKQTI